MNRPQRNAIKKQDSKVANNPILKNCERSQLSKRNSPPDKPKEERSFQSKHGLKDLVVCLEDICHPLGALGRRALGDKTNRSLILSCSRTLKKSSPQQNKTSSCKSSSETCQEMSPQTRKSVTTRVPFDKIESTPKKSGSDLTEGHLNLMDKCIYTGVKRETLKNKNMPPEEKLAEYEFEVDENEPKVKMKKKKNAKRKKNIRSPDWDYHPRKGKVMNTERDMKKPNKVGGEQDLKSKTVTSKANNCPEFALENRNNPTISSICSSQPVTNRDEISVENIFLVENKENAAVTSPVLSSQSVMKRGKILMENTSPEERSKCWVTPHRSVSKCLRQENKTIRSSASSCTDQTGRRLNNVFTENLSPDVRGKVCEIPETFHENEFSEMEVSASENYCQFNLKATQNTSYPSQEQNLIDNSCVSKKTHILEFEPDEKSSLLSTSISTQKSSNVNGAAAIKTPVPTTDFQQSLCLSESDVSSPVLCSPLSKKNKKEDDVQSSLDSSESHYTYRPKLYMPRVSGVHRQFCKASEENWNVENCFGFEDEIQETEILTPEPQFAVKRRGRQKLPVSSTPLITNRKDSDKEGRLSTFFKRQQELTSKAERLPKAKFTSETQSPKLAQTGEKSVDSPKRKKLSSSESTVYLPFSNPLKQQKLDSALKDSKTSSCETPQRNDEESPLLFKDPNDKTPTHFKEPARRSYVRSVRRKMKPVGDEWVEMDSDSEEEHEQVHKFAKKIKKDRQNKKNEKEANMWIKSFNDQCEEIEEFELCVE